MNIGVVAWKLSTKLYHDATRDCLRSIYHDCNKIIIVSHETSDSDCVGLMEEFPKIKFINNPTWGNNLSFAWNYMLEEFFSYSECALMLGNDVVVRDGTFSWFNPDQYRESGMISARDTIGLPEYIFAAFILFKGFYNKVGPFDHVNFPLHCNDADFMKRMKKIGVDIHKDIYSDNSIHSDKRFVVEHKRSMSLREARNKMTEEEKFRYSADEWDKV